MSKTSAIKKEFLKSLKGKCGYCPLHAGENTSRSKSHPHVKKTRTIKNWKEKKRGKRTTQYLRINK